MITYFPNMISRKAMTNYFIALSVVSVLFMSRILPFVWMLFGAVEVCAFFYFCNDLTKRWRTLYPQAFLKKLFWTALAVRLAYMVFIYFFYDAMTGQPFMFHSADEQTYYGMSKIWREQGFEALKNGMRNYGVDDSGGLFCGIHRNQLAGGVCLHEFGIGH